MNGPAPLPLRILGRLIGLAIIVVGVAAAVMAARTSTENPRTDDAYVSANVIGIAPHVQGPLVQLNVVDNQPVEANDLLFVIDPRPYEAELQRAQGELIVARAEVSGIEQAIAAGRAEVARLQADTTYARTHAGRLEPLVGGRFISTDEYQEAVTKARSLDAAVQRAQSQVAQQEKLLAQQGDVNGRLETAKARVRLAELNVAYCYVRAPFKGLVTNFNISLGDYAHVGERVFALVDRRMWYVLGNFRETLLPAIEPGMEARVNLVGYPGRTFHGVVQGIAWSVLSPAGQTTGLLPKIDPTLNWARLAQRIPVRIILDAPPSDAPFRMGMTAVATIIGFPPDGKPLSVPGMPVTSVE
ncbi:MAG TPA: HlyD family secretion protein [Stellaceae bacterium]|jgi:multidrug resistance efflux pump|nr:HlyD family secretion protein [Stellaceae bacterium]